MAVLILAKHDNATLNDATAKTVTAAKAVGGDITVLVAGQACAAVAGTAARLDGVREGHSRRGRGLWPPPRRAVDRARMWDGGGYSHILSRPPPPAKTWHLVWRHCSTSC